MSAKNNKIVVDINKEIYKHNGVNEYDRNELKDVEEDEQLISPGTIN